MLIKGKQNCNSKISFIRFIATIGVLFIHVSGSILVASVPENSNNYITALLFDSFSRASVPLFFMISGYVLLAKKNFSIKELPGRLRKILIPFFIVSILYYLFRGYIFHIPLSIGDFLLRFITNDVYYHLWFIYHLLGIYLLLPIIHPFIHSKESKITLNYYIIMWFIVTIITEVARLTGVTIAIPFSLFIGNIGYFILGYVLFSKQKPNTIKALISTLSWGLISVTITVLLLSLSIKTGVLAEKWFMYNSTLVMLATIFVSYSLLYISQHFDKMRIWQILEKYSYGIYLLHIFFLEIFISTTYFSKYAMNLMQRVGIGGYILIVSTGIYILSLFVTITIQYSFKILKRIIQK